MKLIAMLGLAAVLFSWSGIQAAEAKKNEDGKGDAQQLVGLYEMVEGERAGQKIEGDRLSEVAVRIAKNAITTYDKDMKEVYVATYELDTSQEPWRIKMKATLTPVNGKGTIAEGLIEKDGETVRLIYALPGGKSPTEFQTSEGQQMFVLKRKSDKE